MNLGNLEEECYEQISIRYRQILAVGNYLIIICNQNAYDNNKTIYVYNLLTKSPMEKFESIHIQSDYTNPIVYYGGALYIQNPLAILQFYFSTKTVNQVLNGSFSLLKIGKDIFAENWIKTFILTHYFNRSSKFIEVHFQLLITVLKK